LNGKWNFCKILRIESALSLRGNGFHTENVKFFYKIGFAVSLAYLFAVGHGMGAQGATLNPGFAFTRNLALGIQGNDVSVLQQFLIEGGYLQISTSTGYFGPLTSAALGSWQASEGISPSVGYFGPISRSRIDALVPLASINVTTTPSTVETTTSINTTASTTVANNENGSPVRLIIPKLSIDAGFQYTGFESDGTMAVPTNIYDAGWFTDSVRPGEKGVAIVTGHVAQVRGGVVTKLGVFNDLHALQPGDRLSVVNDQGKSIAFVVREVRSYDPAADATDVFTSSDGGAHLNLITCEGTWNPSQVSYSQRLVVFTDAAQ
jgi:sortase (surface protein transpeptidase)